ncbi:unnamed protein product [Arctogadus glacialis]
MSCLAACDEDDKDTDPEMNALTLLQEPVRMTQAALSYIDSFGKPALAKQNGVLDVLSNAEMLSPVGLGNGPSSHRATQAHDLNSLCTEEEEKSITPLKTVQEIDTAGIWGFDVDSPEDSLDDFSSARDLQWDPHKEFMQFLWDDHDESPGEEMQKEVMVSRTQKRRKRKMDMVVMVDPSEDLYPNLGHKSSEDSHDGEDQAHSVPMSKVQNLRMHSKSSSTENKEYPNGTVKAIKQILYNAPTFNSFDNNIGHRLSPLKGRLPVNSPSEPKPSYPCSKCHLVFRKEISLQQHLELHSDLSFMSPSPFICQECGHIFRESSSLLEHMAVHTKRRKRQVDEINVMSDTNKAGNDALCCPQCPFQTNCQNTFVKHALTHSKSKRCFKCEKCKFHAVSERGLRRHNTSQHKDSGRDEAGVFSCTICSYRVFSKNVFRNHLQCRHKLTIEKYESIHSLHEIETNAQLPVEKQDSCKMEHSETKSKIFVPSKKANSISNVSNLFKHEKMTRRFLKSQETQSKLDKSIDVLLSRQRHDKDTEAKRKKESDNVITSKHSSNNDDNDLQDHLQGMHATKLPESRSSSNGEKQTCVSKPDANPCEYSVTEEGIESNRIPKSTSDQAIKKTPSKRKMSTPFRNTTEQDSCFILPKHLPSPKMLNRSEEITNCEEKDIFKFKETLANTNLFDDDDVKQEEKHIYTYSRRMSMRGVLQASKKLFDKITTDGNDDEVKTDIKEECIETEVFGDSIESHSMTMEGSYTDDSSDLEPKSCPYCPEVFESGVGLSNHVRGHLHRVGLNYNERHVVPAEHVASQDKKPRMRRRISPIPQLEEAVLLESPADPLENSDDLEVIHSCPLCGDKFDNRTGQSNHIRGHLKQLGRPIKSKNKTPLCLLRELMRDKKEVNRAIQILNKKRNKFSFRKSSKLARSHSLTGLFKNNYIPTISNDAKSHFSKPQFSLLGVASEKKQLETKLEVKGSLSSASALIGILKKRKCQEDPRIKASQISKSTLSVCSDTEHGAGSRLDASLLNSIAEKGEFNRKVCMHCNASFHSGVSLSNHLRAYAKRKRNASLDGAMIDCKGRRPRSRPGSKKKTLPLPQTPEEMYRLTCRFCDLVFQGPLSVQEDWIKHLQRHIMNTGVPNTGLGMVEVSMQPRDPSSPRPDQDGPSTGPHHAAS